MLELILRSFKAAWKWPEVVHESRVMIYLSRALLAFLPVLSIASTLATGYSDSNSMFGAVMFSIAIALSFVIAIFLLFKSSYYRVQKYEDIEKKAKNSFNEFPEFSECPIRQYGYSWVGYGHIKPHHFIKCVCDIISGITQNRVDVNDYIKDEEFIKHIYAKFVSTDITDDRFTYCDRDEEDSFPVTVLDI